MFKLIKLELKRINLKPFLIGFGATAAMILLFTYFFAFVALAKPEEAAANQAITTYSYVFQMTSLITLVSFSIFASVLFSKFIIEEYKGDAVFLLFTYPVSRSKILIAKITLCASLIFVSTILSQLCVYGIFLSTEKFMPIMNDQITTSMLMNISISTITIATQCSVIGIIAMHIGFIKKSLATTIVSSVAISMIFCNILTLTQPAVLMVITFIIICCLPFTIAKQIKNINKMQLDGEY